MAGLFMLKDFQFSDGLPGQDILNIYGYVSFLTVTDEITSLIGAWIAQKLPSICAIQQGGTEHSRIEVYKLNTVDFDTWTLSSDNVGLRPGPFETGFLAWGFRYNRATVGQRSGGKRIGLVADGDVAGGQPIVGIEDELAACADAMGSPIMEGLVETWFPVILKKPAIVGGTWTSAAISGVSWVSVTSQNTRKP